MGELVPVRGAFVARYHDNDRVRPGLVYEAGEPGSGRVKVLWGREQEPGWIEVDDLTSAFMVNMEVMHRPQGSTQKSLGWGIVRATREIAGSCQVLVEFPESEKQRWLPWQRLQMLRGVKHRFHVPANIEQGNASEKQRLKLLAWAIKLWNENTGALATFDIDPLPHQIHLVHHILASGNYNWLIADDVGLGKTIEIGLLLSALGQRGEARRVLLITPAGLTRQWQEEMDGKFGIDSFRIYGHDFYIKEPRQWKMYDHVIGSMDQLKQSDHLEMLLQSEPWDLVIVDEGHRLTRRQFGNKFDSSQRYDLVKSLRKKTESLLLLTATPHQGKEDAFVGLLELLHPDRRNELLTLSLNPEIIGEMVFRNFKADVTDMDGNFIFHGKTVSQIEVPASEASRLFDKHLRRYLKKGYAASEATGTNVGRAIGFVMTVYRKLAASSIAAIHTALERRRERLLQENDMAERVSGIQEDERYQGEQDELWINEARELAQQFFEGELELLDELIEEAASLRRNDIKLESFMDGLVTQVLSNNTGEKILVFTEYRSTQSCIADALIQRFGEKSAVMIHGGMDMQERRNAIAAFEEEGGQAQFLVSTEAGGEGINLQQQCHIMVNYDLPWNPMRLVQRVGRLYRYGQQKRVVVFNVHQAETADEQVLDILYQRLDRVAQDMASVEDREFNDAMKEDVLGELADLVDIEYVLQEAGRQEVSRTSEQIEDALSRAREAASKQKELFRYASGFDPDEVRRELSITTEHLQAFVAGMSELLDIEIIERTHSGQVWQLRFPENILDEVGITRSRYGITFDRMIAARRQEFMHMNIDSWLLQYLLDKATSYDFGGVTALCTNIRRQALIAAIARWQNDRGKRARQELTVIDVENDAQMNPEWLNDWLCEPQPSVNSDPPDRESAKAVFQLAEQCIEKMLQKRSGGALMPDQPQWVTAAWKAR